MIPKSGNRLSEKIMLKQKDKRRGSTETPQLAALIAGTALTSMVTSESLKRLGRAAA
jgi:hypothetical protein